MTALDNIHCMLLDTYVINVSKKMFAIHDLEILSMSYLLFLSPLC